MSGFTDEMIGRLRELGFKEKEDKHTFAFWIDTEKLDTSKELDRQIIAALPPRPPLILVKWRDYG